MHRNHILPQHPLSFAIETDNEILISNGFYYQELASKTHYGNDARGTFDTFRLCRDHILTRHLFISPRPVHPKDILDYFNHQEDIPSDQIKIIDYFEGKKLMSDFVRQINEDRGIKAKVQSKELIAYNLVEFR